MLRIGNGFDIHKLSENRKLILGGVNIPYEKGLLGHSDADGLIHVIIDAFLGALSLGDIGQHFPDTDFKYKNINSLYLLKKVYNKIQQKSFSLINLDSVIICQAPKLVDYIDQMKFNISNVLKISPEKISIKATSSENITSIGRKEGIAFMSTVLIAKKGSIFFNH